LGQIFQAPREDISREERVGGIEEFPPLRSLSLSRRRAERSREFKKHIDLPSLTHPVEPYVTLVFSFFSPDVGPFFIEAVSSSSFFPNS